MRRAIGLAIALLGATISIAAMGATDTATTNATFVIPSWISLAVVENGSIGFPEIIGPGTYSATADPRLRVLSTASWTLTEAILWSGSTIPTGADEATIDRVFVRTPEVTSGAWGLTFINVAFELVITDDDLANMPEGTYNVLVQYTATTD